MRPAGGGERGGFQQPATDTGKRNLQWNPVGQGLVYYESVFSSAGGDGGTAGAANAASAANAAGAADGAVAVVAAVDAVPRRLHRDAARHRRARRRRA